MAKYRDLGFPPMIEGIYTGGWGLTTVDDVILLGAWRRPMDGRKDWSLSDFAGKVANTFVKIPGLPRTVLAGGRPFYRSQDGGRRWCAGGVADLASQDSTVEMYSLTVQSGPEAGGIGVLYATMSDRTIVRSFDGGATWPFRFVEPVLAPLGGVCTVHVPAWDPDTLYEGCNAGYSTIVRRSIFDRTGPLGEPTVVVDATELGGHSPGWYFTAASKPGVIYVGLWGGLLRIEGDRFRWIYRYSTTGSGPQAWGDRTHMNTFWMDPCDPSHLVFGGDAGLETRMFDLYETFDDGFTVQPISPPSPDLSVAGIAAGSPGGPGGKDLVLIVRTRPGPIPPDPPYDVDYNRYRVLVRSHSAN